jgi:pimeloyl-ACP methyl ester carboxylesterase
MKTVRTPVLDIAYEESGPSDGRPVVLMHGLPDDIHANDGVAPALPPARKAMPGISPAPTRAG